MFCNSLNPLPQSNMNRILAPPPPYGQNPFEYALFPPGASLIQPTIHLRETSWTTVYIIFSNNVKNHSKSN